ncbi:MAG: glycosyltransferase [Patescibacteria group bacterium]|nr:glycosyltransferase [Patescibacteria group bacterium]
MRHSKKLRVALLTPDFPPNPRGGCGVSSNLLVQELRKLGLCVDVYRVGKKEIAEKSSSGNIYHFVGFRKVPMINNLFAVILLRGRLKKYDIIHVYNMSLIPAAVLLKGRDSKIFATINNTNGAVASTFVGKRKFKNKINDWLTTWMIKLFRGGVDCYIALTAFLRRLYIENGYVGHKIKMVPNMYDEIFVAKRNKESRKDGHVRILYVGQLGDNKGVLDLAVVCKDLLNDKKWKDKLKVKIIGDGKLRGVIETILKREIESGSVEIFNEQYEDLPDEYWNSDLLIHPAKWDEPFSRTWLEAMASELPILSSDNSSAKEVLAGYAIFFKMGDRESLKRAMLEFLKNKTREDDGFFVERFNPKKVTNKIVKYYQIEHEI